MSTNTSARLLATVPEGTCVMTGLWGKKIRPCFLLAYKGHHLDKDNNVVCTESWSDDDPRWKSMGIQIPSPTDDLFIGAGLHPVGLPWRSVLSWEQTWSEWTHLDKDGNTVEERLLWVRKEKTSRFMVKNFSYAFRMKEVETSLGIKVDLDFTVYVEGVNPEIAMVKNDDWYMRFEGEVQDRVKNFIGAKDLFDLMSEEKKAKALLQIMHPLQAIKEQRLEKLKAAGEPIPVFEDLGPFDKYVADTTILVDGEAVPLPKGLGVKITDASFESFGLSASEGPLLELMSSTTRQGIKNDNTRTEADAKKYAAVEAGKGEAEAMDVVTAARVKRWNLVDKEISASPAGVTLATVEAQTSATVRVAEVGANALVQSATLGAEALGKVATAVEKNKTLTTVVFPNGGAQPVVPVGGK